MPFKKHIHNLSHAHERPRRRWIFACEASQTDIKKLRSLARKYTTSSRSFMCVWKLMKVFLWTLKEPNSFELASFNVLYKTPSWPFPHTWSTATDVSLNFHELSNTQRSGRRFRTNAFRVHEQKKSFGTMMDICVRGISDRCEEVEMPGTQIYHFVAVFHARAKALESLFVNIERT